jgi:hypothetical protein
MELSRNINEQIDLLVKNEEALAGLYQIYADRFPKHEEFWFGMATEEIDKANLIHEIAQKIKNKKARVYERLSGTKCLEEFNNMLIEETDRAHNKPLTNVDARNTALYLMQYMIEHSYFNIFDSDSEEIRDVLGQMATAIRHYYTFMKEHF